jgi:hypothetical protein
MRRLAVSPVAVCVTTTTRRQLLHHAGNGGGGTVPTGRQIDGMDMANFSLGGAEESGRDVVLCLQGSRLQAVKWHQWKLHLFKQDDSYSTWSPEPEQRSALLPIPATPPPPGQWQPQTLLQLGPITQHVMALVKTDAQVQQPLTASSTRPDEPSAWLPSAGSPLTVGHDILFGLGREKEQSTPDQEDVLPQLSTGSYQEGREM